MDAGAAERLKSYIEAEALQDGTETRARRIHYPAMVHPLFKKVMRDQRLLQIVTQLIGPNFRTQTGKINMKPARVGAPVQWHQDWAFTPHTNDDILVASIFIDDITAENGPIMVIPSSHTGPVYDHHEGGTFVGVIHADVIREHEAKMMPMTGPAGSCSFHHCRIVHGSPRNTSAHDRRMLVFPIISADAWPLAAYKQPLEAVYGEVLSGQFSTLPRLKDVPVRIPYPKPDASSLFEMQRLSTAKYYEDGRG